MRKFGIVVLIIGVLVVISAMGMDVSVSSGLGRVNNLGLMAERQNFTIIGGLLALGGLLMMLFGGKKESSTVAASHVQDTRACPLCAEMIKPAAIKCRFCGADVDPVQGPRLVNGWAATVPCRAGDERNHAIGAITALGFSVVPMMGETVGAGLFATKEEAKHASTLLSKEHKVFSEVAYRDTVSGKFPPLDD